MPIAIYRHLKLTVAVPRATRPTILNFHPRRLKSLLVTHTEDEQWVTSLSFHTLSRHRQLQLKAREVWQFQNGLFTFTKERYRNDQLYHTLSSDVPTASSVVWTENGIVQPVYQQFEAEIATRPIVELYLHRHTPNPHDFLIVQLDLNPRTSPQDPAITSWLVSSREVAELNARLDNSESSERWAQLFLE